MDITLVNMATLTLLLIVAVGLLLFGDWLAGRHSRRKVTAGRVRHNNQVAKNREALLIENDPRRRSQRSGEDARRSARNEGAGPKQRSGGPAVAGYESAAQELIVSLSTISHQYNDLERAHKAAEAHHTAEMERARDTIAELEWRLSLAYVEPMVEYVATYGETGRYELANACGLDPRSSQFIGRLSTALNWGLIVAHRHQHEREPYYVLAVDHEYERDQHLQMLANVADPDYTRTTPVPAHDNGRMVDVMATNELELVGAGR